VVQQEVDVGTASTVTESTFTEEAKVSMSLPGGGAPPPSPLPVSGTKEERQRYKVGQPSAKCTTELQWKPKGWQNDRLRPARIITMPETPTSEYAPAFTHWRIELTQGPDTVCAFDVTSCVAKSDETLCTGVMRPNAKSTGCEFKGGEFILNLEDTELSECKEPIPYEYMWSKPDNWAGALTDYCRETYYGKRKDQNCPSGTVCRAKKDTVDWSNPIGWAIKGSKPTCNRKDIACKSLKQTVLEECVQKSDKKSLWKVLDCKREKRYCDESSEDSKYSRMYFPGPYRSLKKIPAYFENELVPDVQFEGTDRFFQKIATKYDILDNRLAAAEKDYLYCAFMLYPKENPYHMCYGPTALKVGRYSPYRMWKKTQDYSYKAQQAAWKNQFRDKGLISWFQENKWTSITIQPATHGGLGDGMLSLPRFSSWQKRAATMERMYKNTRWPEKSLVDNYIHFSKPWDRSEPFHYGIDPVTIRLTWAYTNQAGFDEAFQAIREVLMGSQDNEGLSNVCLFKMSPFSVKKSDHVVLTFCGYYMDQQKMEACTLNKSRKKRCTKGMLFTKDQVERDIRHVCNLLKPFDDAGLLSHMRQPFQTAIADCPYITFTTYWGSSSGGNLRDAVKEHRKGWKKFMKSLGPAKTPKMFSNWETPKDSESVPLLSKIEEMEKDATVGMALFAHAWEWCNGPSEKMEWDWNYPARDREWHEKYTDDKQTQFIKKCLGPYLDEAFKKGL